MFNLFGKKNKKESAPAEEISADELQFEILRKLHENSGQALTWAKSD